MLISRRMEEGANRRTALVYHERFLWHDPGSAASVIPAGGMVEPGPHAESPERIRRIKSLVEVSGLGDVLERPTPRAATVDELCRVHTAAYVDRVRELSDGPGGEAGDFAPVGRSSFEIAALAAGACLTAVDAVAGGGVDNAYALVRPPGHHALAGNGMGGCLFANTALAAVHAREAHGLTRLAVVDWDAHHGNGTQAAFYEDGDVLTISLHQAGCFPPDSGGIEEVGAGSGRGANLNIPLPPGSGTGAFDAAFERVVVPALTAHEPELVLVACGFDSSAWDAHARLMLHSAAYRRLTRALLDVSDRSAGGRLVVVHEGGYAPAYTPFCGLAVLEELCGRATGVEDPFLPIFAGYGYQELQPHQEAVVAAAESAWREAAGVG
jgi:acetoin utilization deacetylase AcuC-like enzyme